MSEGSSVLAGGRRDLVAGALLALIGAGILAESQRYNLGTLTRMGPGLYPSILGCVMILMGALIALNRHSPGDDHAGEAETTPLDWRGFGCIVGGVLAFIVLGAYGGLAPASFACVFISALGDRTATLKNSVLLALAVTACGALLFSFGLQLQLPLWRFGA